MLRSCVCGLVLHSHLLSNKMTKRLKCYRGYREIVQTKVEVSRLRTKNLT